MIWKSAVRWPSGWQPRAVAGCMKKQASA
jgi:hypothetical protein